MSLFTELKRRNVFRVTAAYVVIGWLVTEVGTTLLNTFGAPDWVAKAIILVIGLGFFPVVVFSWVYELTPEGIKRETQISRDSSITSHTGRKLDLITIVAVLIGIGFLAMSRFVSPPAAEKIESIVTAENASVAVLPFVNMSGSEENEYFSDGLTETLLHMLSQIPGLKVAARTSSFAFKGKEQDVRLIANALNVAHILEGSVQRAGDRVRITAQLIRADDGFHVWSENYDRTLDNIFEIQDEIAERVGRALSASLLGTDDVSIIGVGTENIAAYELFLKGLSRKRTGSHVGLTEAESLFKEALSKDPDFSDAKLELGDLYMMAVGTGLMPMSEGHRKAGALFEQVVDSQPDSVRAQALLFMNQVEREQMEGNAGAYFEATPILEELLVRAPGDVKVRQTLAFTYSIFNFPDKAILHLEKALEYDALNPGLYITLGSAYRRTKQWEKAIAAYQRSLELEAQLPNAYGFMAQVRAAQGDATGYVENFRRAAEIDPRDHELPANIASFVFRLGLLEEGDEFLARAKAMAPTSPATRGAELRRAYLIGDFQQAFDLAEEMLLDDIENRQFSYGFAVHDYVRLSMDRGEAQAAFDFLNELDPGLNDPAADSRLKTRLAQPFLMDLWHAVMTEEHNLATLDALQARTESVNFGPHTSPRAFIRIYASRGDTAGAVQLGLDTLFSRPVTNFLSWRSFMSEAILADVVADPRVVIEMERLEREESEARSALREYFARRL